MSERVDVLAEDLQSGLPVVKGKPESNLLLESDVADKNQGKDRMTAMMGGGNRDASNKRQCMLSEGHAKQGRACSQSLSAD